MCRSGRFGSSYIGSVCVLEAGPGDASATGTNPVWSALHNGKQPRLELSKSTSQM